jgi:hypothetical protein
MLSARLMPRIVQSLLVSSLIAVANLGWCDGPRDNQPDNVRPIPPPGIEVDAATREALDWRCKAIRAQWQTLAASPATNQGDAAPADNASRRDDLASEVLVFPRAVELALEFGQFYRPRDFELASELLDEATRRIDVIQRGGQWPDVVGLTDGSGLRSIIGGYRSSIDGSFQPYGLVVPRGLDRDDARPRRLDIWFHGRGETLSELAFLSQQRNSLGQYTPADSFVLHPYGRYSNAFKFAGEVDVMEALDYIKQRLPVDEARISVRGFSMGGAACWQFATHYADRWFAANPGAGFSETPQFLKFFQQEDVSSNTPSYQQKLWQLYDCPPWARNLMHCPTIAYSGELDRQKQAADVMAEALAAQGMDLVHVIGPQTAHKIHEQSKREIESRLNQLSQQASPHVPRHVEFSTVTLRYHRQYWIDVQGLNEHWTPAAVSANAGDSTLEVTTQNVSRIRFDFGPGQWPGRASGAITVNIDGQSLEGPPVRSDRSWSWELAFDDQAWQAVGNDDSLRKRPGLQGPIDDAFMDTFLFVLPSGKCKDPILQRWIDSESLHAMLHWRKHFRGDIQQKLDSEVTDKEIASANLILFGDPESNQLIRRIVKDLPVRWSTDQLAIGAHSVARDGHAAVLVYPNPLNQDRYVVLNSGFTFREYDYLNNARQTPKLPDWALIDVRQGATSQSPGKVLHAGFFDEQWKP